VAKWQTRSTQNALLERACGFDSHLRHQKENPQDNLGVLLYLA
jgi:hypothetical protein